MTRIISGGTLSDPARRRVRPGHHNVGRHLGLVQDGSRTGMFKNGRLAQGGAKSKRPLQLKILSGNTWFLSVESTQKDLLCVLHT